MPTLYLQDICYTQLDSITWCATAKLIRPIPTSIWSDLFKPLAPFDLLLNYMPFNSKTLLWQINNPKNQLSTPQIAHNRRQQQRKGVRLLLHSLITKLNINDTLNESQFPYRLMNSGYYVCFSHSGMDGLGSGQSNDKVAVAISYRRTIGIDIETQNIAWTVAQRFYHPAEIDFLVKLPIEQRLVIVKWLWQIKESFIKIYHYKLAQGLGMNYMAIIPDLMAGLNKDCTTNFLINDNKSDYQIVILSSQQMLVIF
ncbi:4'-phosphopantetheinyl transferase superfamily protein [Psychrobacter frigidicola]|uniref:4'-phosphopantetheinyl transferase superfamily protein n=1 Tax=Psychrobacter frigidicola TaxID=45611 RepID=A0A5C7AB15_9GAMM|nr:4'-phosphopantetheinyl transferase superfamily protein [Psychrobacter frigidicola]TXD98043.1 4'-phosphopantetheinyl transferase superfamily protein [Psychrobacter frigidicola]